jgi:methionine synthase II (cobalamin-independent)
MLWFRADHIGSLLRPKKLREAFRRHSQKEIGEAELRTVQDASIRDVLRLQKECGLEVATDGEFRRISYWEKFVRLTRGLEVRDAVLTRVDEASRYIDASRLAISPQCGFASTMGGNPVTEADERAKLRLCVDTAHLIWG